MLKRVLLSALASFIFHASICAGEIHSNVLAKPEILDLPVLLASGKTVTLRQLKGNHPLYLKFWASYCQDCLQQMSHLQKIHQKYQHQTQVVAVNLGVNEDIKSVKFVQKKFGLTMPIAIDKTGRIARAVNLIATPYHVILDRQSNVVYAKYTSPSDLDEVLAQVAKEKSLPEIQLYSTNTSATSSSTPYLYQKPTALFFVATWCDWYLKTSRPSQSQRCIEAQNQVNHLSTQYPNINWLGVVSRLWTEDKYVAEYRTRLNVKHPLNLDSTNEIYQAYAVKDVPTLILIKDGKVIYKTRQIDTATIASKLEQMADAK